MYICVSATQINLFILIGLQLKDNNDMEREILAGSIGCTLSRLRNPGSDLLDCDMRIRQGKGGKYVM